MNQTLLHDIPLWGVAIALPIILLLAWGLSGLARLILRGRAKLSTSAGIVIAILATAVAAAVTGWFDHSLQITSPVTVLAAFGLSVGGIALYAAVSAHFQAQPAVSAAQLVAAGESARVEFKSTARVNLHTGTRDDKIEQVIAKTVAAFLNADGGSLLIGVDDAGAALGLDADFATLKSPDTDRYELWLRDLLTTSLGQNAAALVGVEFDELSDPADQPRPVCVVRCRPSPRPVYLRTKSASTELWVRSGNSSRQLSVDEAAEYVMHRWPLNFGSALAAQLLAAVRFSGR